MRTGKVIVVAVALLASGLFLLAQAPPSPPPKEPAPAAPAPPPQGPEKIRGTIVNQGGPLASFFQAGFFILQIDRYGTDDERKTLLQALQISGQQGLLDQLWKMKPIGFIKVGGSMGYPIVFASTRQTPAGRLVRALTNRPIAPVEINSMSRSTDYPFGVLEILFPPDGKGQGTLIPTAQVGLTNSGTLAVEAYGTIPVRLIEVTVDQPKKK